MTSSSYNIIAHLLQTAIATTNFYLSRVGVMYQMCSIIAKVDKRRDLNEIYTLRLIIELKIFISQRARDREIG